MNDDKIRHIPALTQHRGVIGDCSAIVGISSIKYHSAFDGGILGLHGVDDGQRVCAVGTGRQRGL